MFDFTPLWIALGAATLSFAFLDYWASFKKRMKPEDNTN